MKIKLTGLKISHTLGIVCDWSKKAAFSLLLFLDQSQKTNTAHVNLPTLLPNMTE